jgi:hypothetical protein
LCSRGSAPNVCVAMRRLEITSWVGLCIFLTCCAGKHDAHGSATELDPNGYCGDATPALLAAEGPPRVAAEPLTEEPDPSSACNAVVRSYPIPGVIHVPACSAVEYQTNPPSAGDHYAIYPRFGVYRAAIPQGFWVHTLEHGGVVLTYSCTDCEDEVAQAADLLAGTEPALECCSASGCPRDATNQLLMTPDPGLATRWAASSWGFTLSADCFEPDVFQNFIEAHRNTGMTPELICSDALATDVTRPGPE